MVRSKFLLKVTSGSRCHSALLRGSPEVWTSLYDHGRDFTIVKTTEVSANSVCQLVSLGKGQTNPAGWLHAEATALVSGAVGGWPSSQTACLGLEHRAIASPACNEPSLHPD